MALGPRNSGAVVILLAERDPYAAEFSDYFLRTEGYEVVTTLDAHDAEAQYEDRTPRVVVVDLQISGGAGPLCAGPLRTGGARSWPFRPSVTGRGIRERRRCLPAEAAGPAQLISTVQDLLVRSAFCVGPEVTAAPTAARVPSGAPNVDLVLGGGLLENAINLIIGPPGAGKTILAQQYLFNNATKERPAST